MGQTISNLIVAVVGIVGTLITVTFAAPWLMRKVNRDLVKAQANKENAEADEIRDRQTGVWIGRYEQRMAELDDYMDRQEEYHQVHAAWDYNIMLEVRRLGGVIEEPPPLRPPRRARTRKTNYGTDNVDRPLLEGSSGAGS